MKFNKWLDTLVEEKGVDLEDGFQVEKNGELHFFDYGYVVEAIKIAPVNEQKGIQNMLVKIDFYNGDICDYFRHLAQALC